MRISIERNLATDSIAEVYPHIARVEIIDATKDRGAVYQVPIFVRYNGLNKKFGLDVCGYRLEAKTPYLLQEPIEHLLRGLVRAARLPTYVFVARRAKAVYPVYTIHDEVLAVTADGPVFRHVELAKVREYLTDYLHDAHILGKKGMSDKLHVRGISRTTLGLSRPVMYLKKRVPQQSEFWAPVFQSNDGQKIYTYAASDRREVTRQDDEVLQLHALVAQLLQADNRLKSPYDLRPDRLMPAFWERLKRRLDFVEETAVSHITIPLYRHNQTWLGLEHRPEEDRYGLFLGSSKASLINRIKTDFSRRALT